MAAAEAAKNTVEQFTTATNDEGIFIYPSVPPGNYEVLAKMTGFTVTRIARGAGSFTFRLLLLLGLGLGFGTSGLFREAFSSRRFSGCPTFSQQSLRIQVDITGVHQE